MQQKHNKLLLIIPLGASVPSLIKIDFCSFLFAHLIAAIVSHQLKKNKRQKIEHGKAVQFKLLKIVHERLGLVIA